MAIEGRRDDKLLKELDIYLGSITNDILIQGCNIERNRPIAAMSLLNVGQMTFSKLHTNTNDDNCFPVFHPNLVILFSRCITDGSTNHLTDEQERLWNRYIYYATIHKECPWGSAKDDDDDDDDDDSGSGCDCEPYELPLMTQEIRGGAKLRDGTTLGDVELDTAEGMYVDVTTITDKIDEIEKKIDELNGESS